MKKILTLSVTALTEELYVAFMLIVLNIIEKFDVASEKFGPLAAEFKAAYDHMNWVYLKYDLRHYTKQVQELDGLRMTAFRKLRDMVRFGLTYPASPEVKTAADILMDVIALYGGSDICKKKMNERTTQLANLIEDFDGKYAPEVETVGVASLLKELSQAQDKFMEVYILRNEADAEIGLGAMAEARQRMDSAYRDLVAVVNIAAKRDTEGQLDDFIGNMNVVIRKYFVYTKQSGAGSDTGTGDDIEPIPQKTATFTLAGGEIEKIKLAVGAQLIAPANTPGYHWKPEVPELMPNKNTSYREVQNKKVTATFHFLDHREEEVSGIAGTPFTAPANTGGCHWEPEIPAVMPDEDTAFYESLNAPAAPGEDYWPENPDELGPDYDLKS